MDGSLGKIKIVKKAEHWSKHGKTKQRVVCAVELNRVAAERKRLREARKESMYSSIQEALAAASK